MQGSHKLKNDRNNAVHLDIYIYIKKTSILLLSQGMIARRKERYPTPYRNLLVSLQKFCILGQNNHEMVKAKSNNYVNAHNHDYDYMPKSRPAQEVGG